MTATRPSLALPFGGESRPTAAIHMGNPYCSCKLTRVRPFGGLFQAIASSRQRGEGKQAELVGMTAKLELEITDLTYAPWKKAAHPSRRMSEPKEGAQQG